MELKLEHVLLLLLFVFLFKMIMDKCGCRGNNPIEGYANMNECYIDWSKGNIPLNNSAVCPEGTHALSSDWAEMEDTQPPLIFLNDRGEVRYGWFKDSDLNLLDASKQINCATGLVEECATNLNGRPGPAEPGDTCIAALVGRCSAHKDDVFACAQCAGDHFPDLESNGCSNQMIAQWCADTPAGRGEGGGN